MTMKIGILKKIWSCSGLYIGIYMPPNILITFNGCFIMYSETSTRFPGHFSFSNLRGSYWQFYICFYNIIEMSQLMIV